MSERDQDHWESLLGQLGAFPQPMPPRPAKKQTAEEPRRASPPPRVRPPATDWTDVAKDLGVSPADVLPAEVLKRRASEEAAPPARPQVPPAAEELMEAYPRDVEPPSPREEPARTWDRPAAAPPPRPAPEAFGFGAGIFDAPVADEPVETPPPAWLEEVEEETQEKPRRRRRRRGRSRGETPGAEGEVPSDAAPEAADESEEFPPDVVTGEEAERPRRKRRRRSRRDEERRGSGHAGQRRESRRELDGQPAESAASAAADEGPELFDDDEPRDEAEHRNIPSWEEAIGIIVSKNMEARQKSPDGYRSRGRSRGRG